MDSTPPPSLEQGTFHHPLRVRYGETDQMGRVHHANYLLYMEEARTGMMRALGASYASMEREGIGLPVRKTDLRYRAAALYEEELVVETRIDRVGPASVTFTYRIVRFLFHIDRHRLHRVGLHRHARGQPHAPSRFRTDCI